ncbi:MAG: c-type cytochrome [Rhizobiaceae bacterium]
MKSIVFATLALVAGVWSSAAASETLVERGEYLVTGPGGCGNCHSPLGPNGFIKGKELAGRLVEKNPQFTAIAPNITPASRIAKWSDAELGRAIREGIRPDGSLVGPPMPFPMYRGISDDDLAAIVAYLRTVSAVEQDNPASTYNIPLPPAYGPPVTSVASVSKDDKIKYGEYLAGPIAHCMECHTPFGPKGPMFETDFGRGGFEFHGPWGTSVASNLTSHADGLADWSDEDLITMISTGKRPDGSPMLPPMPYPFLAKTTREDLEAMVAYLRTLPPLPDK